MGLGQVTLEAMEEEESHLEKHDILGRSVCLPALRLPVCSKLLYHVRIGLSVDGSLWYCVQNQRWTVTIDLHLANCSTQNAAIFHQLPSSGKFYKLHFMKTWKYTLSSDTSVFAMSAMVTVLQAQETLEGILTCPILYVQIIGYNTNSKLEMCSKSFRYSTLVISKSWVTPWSCGYHTRHGIRGLRVQTLPGSMDFFRA